MKRYLLRVAYDGTAYCGWQIQPNGPTIEGELNKALTELLNQKIEVIGASRTDSGVHSRGNVCVFDAETRIPAEKLAIALNQRLPGDIRVRESKEVEPEFHPRHQDTVKTYEYKIYNDKIENPLTRLYSKFCYLPLDAVKMQQGADFIVGEHDFTAFCSAGSSVESKVRTVYSCDILVDGVPVSATNDSHSFTCQESLNCESGLTGATATTDNSSSTCPETKNCESGLTGATATTDNSSSTCPETTNCESGLTGATATTDNSSSTCPETKNCESGLTGATATTDNSSSTCPETKNCESGLTGATATTDNSSSTCPETTNCESGLTGATATTDNSSSTCPETKNCESGLTGATATTDNSSSTCPETTNCESGLTGATATTDNSSYTCPEAKKRDSNDSWQGRTVTIRITGNGFLYNMVRIIAGTLMDVGLGRLGPDEVEEIIASKDRSCAGDTAEARGLTLVEIKYAKTADEN